MVRGRFVWDQFERLIEKEFHSAAGFSRHEFEALVPEPKRKNGALLIVSEICVNLHLQCELLGIANRMTLESDCTMNQHHNIILPPQGLLYWRYEVEDGDKTLSLSTEAALEVFAREGRIACVTAEVLAIYRENPEVLFGERGHFIDAAGSRLGNRMPGLCHVDNTEDRHTKKEVTLMANNPSDNGFRRWGAASCKAE